jgi:hypothetical protein
MRCVVGNDDQLSFTLTECLEGLFVAKAVFAGFHYKCQASIDGLQGFFLEIKQKKLVSDET